MVLTRIPQHPVDVAVPKTRAPCDPPYINATAPKLDHDRARLPVPLHHSFDAGRGKTPCFRLRSAGLVKALRASFAVLRPFG